MAALQKLERGPAKHRGVVPEIEWTHQPRIMPGEYPPYTRSASIYFDKGYKRWVCAVQVDVLMGDLHTLLTRIVVYQHGVT